MFLNLNDGKLHLTGIKTITLPLANQYLQNPWAARAAPQRTSLPSSSHSCLMPGNISPESHHHMTSSPATVLRSRASLCSPATKMLRIGSGLVSACAVFEQRESQRRREGTNSSRAEGRKGGQAALFVSKPPLLAGDEAGQGEAVGRGRVPAAVAGEEPDLAARARPQPRATKSLLTQL